MILFLLAAALGGPLAGAITPTLFLAISAWFGPPDMKAILGDPVIFWTNLGVLGTFMVWVGLTYRAIFERVRMPARLLLWAGIVVAVYLMISPTNIILQNYLRGDTGVLPSILFSYKTYVPQAILDILVTSLIFVALPASYTHPLWYERKSAQSQPVYK
jgi:hypothetical protein